MRTIKCIGVPEHFNLPWLLAIGEGDFEAKGIQVIWEDYPGGTGSMSKALFEEEADLALLLTEGALTSISTGNPCKIHSFFVDSPLRWGVFTGIKSTFEEGGDFEGATFAISRFYSGSHLMAFHYCDVNGWEIEKDQFNLVGGLTGARASLASKPDQLFMWEKFITKPLVDEGEFKLVDECAAPWPSFSVVVREAFHNENPGLVDEVMEIVRAKSADFFQREEAAEVIAWRYGLKLGDAEEWLRQVKWSATASVDPTILMHVSEVLTKLEIMDKPLSMDDAVALTVK
ncbi:MAG: ABC transporter substrate-binding protein [Flavobacteriales bacterium]|nr:ABC transporter substrate-binding protein [Flavobacteriales bacterium]MDG2246765.1 ABC transporter substrate-binding protein [Flavobacteriales bacterium]